MQGLAVRIARGGLAEVFGIKLNRVGGLTKATRIRDIALAHGIDMFVELGEGRFEPRQVELGTRTGEEVEVLGGISAGERVVTSGTFLIASESRLQAALEDW